MGTGWHNIVLTINNGVYKMYVDGIMPPHHGPGQLLPPGPIGTEQRQRSRTPTPTAISRLEVRCSMFRCSLAVSVA